MREKKSKPQWTPSELKSCQMRIYPSQVKASGLDIEQEDFVQQEKW